MAFETLGERIALLRESATQQEFADALGVSRNTLVRYENNKRAPDAAFLQRLLARSGADANWLLLGVGDAPDELDSREAALLADYRASDEDDKRILERTGASFARSGTDGRDDEALRKASWPKAGKGREARHRK